MNKSQYPLIPLSLAALLVLGLFAPAAQADTMNTPPVFRQETNTRPTPDDKRIDDKWVAQENFEDFIFNGNEWSLDVFGLYAFEAKQGTYDDGFGAGIGVNYFFNRYFGLGLEGYGWKGDGLISSVSGNVMLRYPIEKWRLAPYAIGGIGGNFDADNTQDQINANAGLGLEYRFNAHWGIFTDSRYVFTDVSNDYVITRLGVRFAF